MGKRKAKREADGPCSSKKQTRSAMATSSKPAKMITSEFINHKRNKRRKQLRDMRRKMTEQECDTEDKNIPSFKGHLSQRFCKRKYKKWKHSEEGNTSGESPSISTDDIPGFYYDPEKKKYFKILSSNNNVNVVTRETIEADKAEKKRQKDLLDLSSSTQTKDKFMSTSSSNLAHKLLCSERGEMTHSQMENSILMSNVVSLEPAGSWTVVGAPEGGQGSLEHMMMMDATQDKDKLLGLWSMKTSMRQRLQLLYLSEKRRTCEHTMPLSLSVSATDTTVVQTSNKISNVCWAPFSKSPDRNNVLYTTMCHTGYSYSLAFIRNVDRCRNEYDQAFDYNLGSHVAWTCAWNYCSQRFSVGSEKRGILVDPETRRCWEFDCPTDPFVQVFSPDPGTYLYSGGRNGMVLCHDMRSLVSSPVKYDRHKTSICSAKVTSCGTYLLSSDISGKVILWDIRTRQPVMDYVGLFNRYSRIPIQLDESEQLIYGAGQDCYTRFWCLKTGKLLRSLPPPCLAARETIPSIQYSTRWANRNGNAGLIMGLGDELHFYAGLV